MLVCIDGYPVILPMLLSLSYRPGASRIHLLAPNLYMSDSDMKTTVYVYYKFQYDQVASKL